MKKINIKALNCILILFLVFTSTIAFGQNISGATTICPNTTYTYSASIPGCTGTKKMLWNVSGGTFVTQPTNQSTSVQIRWSTSTGTKYVEFDEINCTMGSNARKNVSIVSPANNISLSTSPTGSSFCESETITITASGNGAAKHNWYYSVNGSGLYTLGAVSTTNILNVTFSNLSYASYGDVIDFIAKVYPYASGGYCTYGGKSNSIGGFTFYQDVPAATFSNPQAPSSKCTSDGKLTVAFGRYPNGKFYSGEQMIVNFERIDGSDFNGPYTITSSPFTKSGFTKGNWKMIIQTPLVAGSGQCSSKEITGITIGTAVELDFQSTYPKIIQSISCNSGNEFGNNSDGQIQVRVINGKPNYTYQIFKNGSNTALITSSATGAIYTFTGLGFGDYVIKVSDGCTGADKSTKTSGIVKLEEPKVIKFTNSSTAVTNETCNGTPNNGSINPTIGGGASPYSYRWSGGSTATSRVISGLSGTVAGKSYTLTVIDNNGCKNVNNFTVFEPEAITILNTGVTNETCNGSPNNGSIIPTIEGGTPPYSYQWSGGSTAKTINLLNISGSVSGISYTLIVTDINGCTNPIPATFTVTEPAPIFISGSVVNATCIDVFNGSINITKVEGGTPPYSYSWSSGQGSADISGLKGSDMGFSYILTVTDGNGCLGYKTFQVYSPPAITATASIVDELCFGTPNNGSIETTIAGGTAPYTYQWSGGSISKDKDINNLSGTTDGTIYTLSVTDNLGCTNSFDYTIYEPAELLASSSKSDYNGYNISCNGATDGIIDVDVSGGTIPYTYQWSGNSTATSQDLAVGAGTYNVLITDDHGCTVEINDIILTEPNEVSMTLDSQFNVDCKGNNSGAFILSANGGTGNYEYSNDNGLSYQASETFSSLFAGDYQVKVKDSNGCETASQLVTITEPDQLIATATVNNVTCYGGTDGAININASGGTINYSYSLNGSLPQSDNEFTGITAGTYTVTVYDANGCTTSFSKTVGTPSPIAGSVALVSPVSCNGDSDGALSVSASGGTGALTYLWSTGASIPAISGLPAGNYSVTVTDQNNCLKVLNYVLNEPDLLTIVTESVHNVSCNGGSDAAIDVSLIGGTSPYFYSWSEGSTSQDLTGLAVNDYTLSVTDNRGCTAQQTFSISEPEPLGVTIQQAKNISCFEGNDGQIVLEASGGTTPYEFSKDGGSSWQSETFVNLKANAYTFDVRDVNGCTQSISANLTEPTEITIVINNIQNTTCGDPIGGAESSVSGGVSPYQYSWKNAGNTEVSTASSMANVYSGIYNLYITDDNGCTKSEVVVITNTDGADISITGITATQCYSSSDGQATVVINTGVGPFSTLWSNGETTNTATNLIRGNHQVTVTDGNNCETIATVNVPSPLAIDYSVISTQSPTCFGEADASIVISASGGTSPYNYLWETGTVGNTLSGVLAGAYRVTITDDHNCSTIETIVIPETHILSFSLITEVKPTCIGNTDGILEITGLGGTGPYSYDWGAYGTTARVENLSNGIYPVTITDANGCTTLEEVVLNDPEPINLAIITLQQPSCVGQSNGFIEIAGTGGTSPYSYLWQNGVTGNQLTNVSAGIYQVTITDRNGCSGIQSVTLNEPTPLTLNIIETSSPSCYGFGNGSIEVEAVGGTSPYFYNWSNGITGATLNDLTAGSYIVNLQDNNGCTTSLTIDLTEPDPLTMNVTELLLPNCFDTTDGEIAVEVQGGTAPYSYSWNTGASTPQISNIGQGDYQLTITDANNCELQQSIQLQGVEQIKLNITTTDPQCFGYDDGEIVIVGSGGTGDLVYELNNSQTELMITGLIAGDYTMAATDENGCITTEVVTLLDPDPIEISLEDDEICQGGSYPISLNLGDGYSYSWVGNNGFSSTSNSILLQEAGDYSVLATDINGCTGSDDFTISVNNDLLNADFLLISEAYVGDTIIMIDISWPIPDQLAWSFDENVTVLSENNDYAEVVFNDTGIFTVDIETTLADCQDYYSQSITILDRATKPNAGGRQASQEPLIKSFKVNPNPNDGEFNIKVELTEMGDINLKLIDLQGNQILLNLNARDSDVYTLPVNMPYLRPGIYIMRLVAGKENKILRFIVR